MKRVNKIGIALSLSLALVTITYNATYAGWVRSTDIVAAYQDGTVCFTESYKLFGITWSTREVCEPCCQ